VPEMAKKHVKKRIVISIDIKDFFHSIREDLVSTILQELRIEATPARTLTELCTYKYYVPQGAVTSPKISNMVIARTFGPELKRYCDEKGYVLTIYADDITISSKNEILRPYEVIQKVTDELNKYYFRVNKQKVKVMSTKTRQWVCGVVVNEKTNLWKQKRLKLRALIHNIVTNGIEPEARKNNLEPAAFIQSVRGMVNWFNQVNPVQGGKLVKKLNEYLSQHPITA
jgi:RNA-directed DNA polymerase